MKKHFLLSTFLFATILISILCSSLTSNVFATEQSLTEVGITISNNVMGLDMTKYTVVPKECPTDSSLGTIVQQNIRYNLESNGSTLDMLYTFAEGKLRIIDVIQREGTAYTTKSAKNELEMAKSFLNDFKNYSGNIFYGKLASMLDAFNEVKKTTEIADDVKLEVSTSDNSTTFRWTYMFEGIEAPSKCVVLGYEKGFLKYFINNWDYYKIGSTSVNLSEEEAIDIAIENAENFSWKMQSGNKTIEVNRFNVTQAMVIKTLFSTSVNIDNARNKDAPLTIYPMRYLWVSLDKFYPGNVYGIEVYIWADTKEVFHIQERFSTLPVPDDLIAKIEDCTMKTTEGQLPITDVKPNFLLNGQIVVPIFSLVMLATMLILRYKKDKIYWAHNFPKFWSYSKGIVLLLLLAFSTVLLVPISTVSANNYSGRSTIWGSESTGDTSYYGATGRKTDTEISAQQNTAQYINTKFYENGYDSSDYQGEGSIKASILSNISYNEANYPRVAVVDFDHGVGRTDYPGDVDGTFHYMLEDNVGMTDYYNPDFNHLVFDMDIYSNTDEEKTFFAFINTCMSANITFPVGLEGGGFNSTTGEAVGMPFAWTHGRQVVNKTATPGFNTEDHMSKYGYIDPDNGKFCYLGFPWGSAALSQNVDPAHPTKTHSDWVNSFFNYSLGLDMTIIQALDHASYTIYESGLGDTLLYKNFTAEWPMYRYNETSQEWEWQIDRGYNSTLAVYGNGNLKLYQPLLTVIGKDSAGNPLAVDVEIDDEYVGSTGVSERVFATFSGETHSIEVTEPYGYTFQNITDGINTYGSKSIGIPIESDITLTAYFTQDPPPPQVPVTFVIDSTAVGDSYSRYHAFTVDNPIPHTFWTGDWYNQNPGAIIGITGTSLHYETTRYLTEGYHNIEYAVSSYVGYWSVTITANGQQVVTSQSTTAYNHATAQIYVTSNPPPPTYTLNIQYDGGGYTSPAAGQHQYSSGTQVPVTAYDVGYWYFTDWTLDSVPYGSNNPTTVTMNSNHNLVAHFVYDEPPPPPPSYYVTLEIWGNYPPWALLYEQTSYVQEGTYELMAPSTYGGLPFYGWYYEGDYYYNPTIWLPVYSDTYIAAVYMY